MDRRGIALKFIDIFCAGDIQGLEPLLAKDLHFNGPLFQFRSRKDYLQVLSNNPPEKCSYHILSVTENTNRVSVYYRYEKTSGAIIIAQLFTFKGQYISEILLVFDTKKFR